MRRQLHRAVASLLALLVLAAPASAQTPDELQRELDRAERDRTSTVDELAERRADERDARQRLQDAEAELQQAEGALLAVERALDRATQRRDEARQRSTEIRGQLRQVESELAASEAELDEARTRFEARVAGAFKRGSTHAETALVGSMLTQDSIADALATAPFLTAVLDADRRVVDDVRTLVSDVEAKRAEVVSLRNEAEEEAAEAEAAAAEVSEQLAAQELATAELDQRRAELDAAHEGIVDDRRAVESHLASLEAESQRLEGELAEIAERRAREAREREEARRAQEEAEARERERQQQEQQQDADDEPESGSSRPPSDGGGSAAPPSSSGSWTWPAACHRVTSRYGARWGRMHQGVDIACTRVMGPNPPIHAARAGQVAPVSCGSGYGICVIIDHLDGDFTLYAHMSGLAVGSGSSVSAGQVIGYEGSTGNSTGPHLHFELWKGGVKTDPCPHIGC